MTNKFSPRIYVAYSVFYIIGTFYAMLIPFVGYSFKWTMASHGFIFLDVFLIAMIRSHIGYGFGYLDWLSFLNFHFTWPNIRCIFQLLLQSLNIKLLPGFYFYFLKLDSLCMWFSLSILPVSWSHKIMKFINNNNNG